MLATEILTEADLAHFTGTTCYYRFPLTGLRFTDGVHHIAEHGGAVWLLTDIAAYQHEPRIRREPFQHWKLTVSEDQTARLICGDGNGKLIHEQEIPWTDFPLAEIAFYLTDNVLMLVSEY